MFQIQGCINANLVDGIAPVIKGFLEKNKNAFDESSRLILSELADSIESSEAKLIDEYLRTNKDSKAEIDLFFRLENQQYDNIKHFVECIDEVSSDLQSSLNNFIHYVVDTRKKEFMEASISIGFLDKNDWEYLQQEETSGSVFSPKNFHEFVLEMINLGFIEQSEYDSLKQRGYFKDGPLFSDL